MLKYSIRVDFKNIPDDAQVILLEPGETVLAHTKEFIGGRDICVAKMYARSSMGRNFVEVLRVVDSLQLTANYSVATPANWAAGEKVIVVTAISTEDAIKKFPKGVEIVKPYLRFTPQPNID